MWILIALGWATAAPYPSAEPPGRPFVGWWRAEDGQHVYHLAPDGRFLCLLVYDNPPARAKAQRAVFHNGVYLVDGDFVTLYPDHAFASGDRFCEFVTVMRLGARGRLVECFGANAAYVRSTEPRPGKVVLLGSPPTTE